ncbi:MAG: ArsR/SmtB family transcription factor [Candidatus Puniceispirillaceae bacterium]
MPRPPETPFNTSKLTMVLKAMSNLRRMQILSELADGKERSVSQIEVLMPELSQSALSQHLARLRKTGLVSTRRESQTIYYTIQDADVKRILRLLNHIYADDPANRGHLH